MLQLLFENVYPFIPFSFIEISRTTDHPQRCVSHETKTERKISNYPSENCLTYMSGENMGRRPSSSHTHSPTVKRVMRGIPDLVQCHECWALFSSSAWRVNQLYSVTAFSSIQIFFHKEQSLFIQTKHPVCLRKHFFIVFFIRRVYDNAISWQQRKKLDVPIFFLYAILAGQSRLDGSDGFACRWPQNWPTQIR